MGGVDLGDQLLSVYDPDIRSVKLWKKILVNLLLTACVNAYICHKRSFLLGRKLTHLQFQQDIVTGLVGDHTIQRRVLGRNGEGATSRATSEHFLFEIPGRKRRNCVSCHSRKDNPMPSFHDSKELKLKVATRVSPSITDVRTKTFKLIPAEIKIFTEEQVNNLRMAYGLYEGIDTKCTETKGFDELAELCDING
ncbi:unnamed protein product [Mytilus edulis]|uniref:PiggyBac transposable element-derived protein domain-containing protein n=1 Tax=Mytilus edulis TaxID=6550 RepID=A0A8S3RDQ7_MYTED|nr:unnamed protein product [Mytilus edulis]